jgi:ribosomal protein L7/L12
MYSLSTEQERQIRELIAREQKIAAIKLYREATGASLRDAKEAVEAMERGTADYFPKSEQIDMPDTSLDNRIKRLLAERKKIEAVKVYRDAYKCGLKEAKDAVDAIEMQMRMGGSPRMSSTPAISNDPFAEDTQRNRSYLALVVAIVILVLGAAAFIFLSGNGF